MEIKISLELHVF